MPTRVCVNNSSPVRINFSATVGAYFAHTQDRTRRRHHRHHPRALLLAIDRSASKVADHLVLYVAHSSSVRILFHRSMQWVGESESPQSTVRYVSVACAEGGRAYGGSCTIGWECVERRICWSCIELRCLWRLLAMVSAIRENSALYM